MTTAKEIYGDERRCWYDYQPMLDEFGNIVLQCDEDNYQGDSFIIYEKDGKYGYLTFGWGSCSGCDALQACDTIDEVQELMDGLYSDIIWFESLEALKGFFETKDWSLCYEWHIDEFKEFLKRVAEL